MHKQARQAYRYGDGGKKIYNVEIDTTHITKEEAAFLLRKVACFVKTYWNIIRKTWFVNTSCDCSMFFCEELNKCEDINCKAYVNSDGVCKVYKQSFEVLSVSFWDVVTFNYLLKVCNDFKTNN